jgi:hypothetical protein
MGATSAKAADSSPTSSAAAMAISAAGSGAAMRQPSHDPQYLRQRRRHRGPTATRPPAFAGKRAQVECRKSPARPRRGPLAAAADPQVTTVPPPPQEASSTRTVALRNALHGRPAAVGTVHARARRPHAPARARRDAGRRRRNLDFGTARPRKDFGRRGRLRLFGRHGSNHRGRRGLGFGAAAALGRELGVEPGHDPLGETPRRAARPAEVQQFAELLVADALKPKILALGAGLVQLAELTAREFAIAFGGQDLFKPVLIHDNCAPLGGPRLLLENVAHQGSQFGARAIDPRFHRSQRDLQPGRNLLVTQFVGKPQQQNLAVILRQ